MSEPELDQWATHLPALVAAASATTGSILECGVGIWSTPILHALCAPTQRRLVSLEASMAWLNRFAPLANDWHELRYINAWPDVTLSEWARQAGPWALAFVDHGYAPRGPVVAALRESAGIVVMHDSECGYCGYTEPLRAYDWCWTHTHSPAWTTLAGMGAPPPWLSALLPGVAGVPVPYR